MTRKQKTIKRKLRASKRAAKRMEKYITKIKSIRNTNLGRYVPLSAFVNGSIWADSNSPTGYSQVCSYEVYGTCQAPCNGDC